jgi:mannose/fructose/N-acetylgalactosamine-specific phosphotransferase system component IIC
MHSQLLHAILVGIWGGLLALERRAFLQAMFSRPLVGGTVTGLILGDVSAGLFTGLVFELLYLGSASLGGVHAEHDSLASVVGASFAASIGASLGSDSTPAIWALAILLAVPFGLLGAKVEGRLDTRAQKYFVRAQSLAISGNFDKAVRQNLRAMWPQFVFYGLTCFASVYAGTVIANAQAQLPLNVLRGLAWAYPALGTLACALAVSRLEAPHRYSIGVVCAMLAFALAMLGFGGAFL